MNDHLFFQTQVLQVRQLIEEAADDPILLPQLEARLQGLENDLRSAEQDGTLFPSVPPTLPRVALFLRGGGVEGSEGIRPALAGEVLIQYERMFTEQALRSERLAARQAGRCRRRRGSPTPSLLFTGTPRGSFGLELVPHTSPETGSLEVHSQALDQVAVALANVTRGEDSFRGTVSELPPGLLRPMKRFLATLAQYGAELRLASSTNSAQTIPVEKIRQAAERFDRDVKQEESKLRGIFRGLTRETMVFDLIADGLGVISGELDEGLTEAELDRIDLLTNTRCTALVQETTVRSVNGISRKYILLDASPEVATPN